jgi:hypothetical protein
VLLLLLLLLLLCPAKSWLTVAATCMFTLLAGYTFPSLSPFVIITCRQRSRMDTNPHSEG